uniref:USP domain-containing protein n=1 Tax=Periophthalmus magnuspinnatus TaxID=409849 RepID=A0A3B3Z7G7_9GOBI
MVVFTDWFRSPVISRSACGLPMAGEDTGLEAVASPMVGYLGKERATSLDNCPWCQAKGQTYALHSCHLNFEEKIMLCTNPQCLFPLVSRPLEDVLVSLVPVEPATGTKRKSPKTLVADDGLRTTSPKGPQLKELESSNDDKVHNTVGTSSRTPFDVEAHVGHFDVENTLMLSDIEVAHSETEDMPFTETNLEEELVSAPVEIFWQNKDNLCWLDSLLVALANLRSIRNLKPKDEPRQSPMWTLLAGYDDAYATIQNGFLKVPNHLLHKINTDLESLRMSVFNLLQPKLHCKLGQNETPVFALPLLVKLDSWLESLFQSTFYWDFRCTECKSNTKENVVKTLPTFTSIVPDWHPLRAVHLAPCNNCHRKKQRRRMVLQEVPPVFALHFVEGLPDNNIQVYNFSFKKKFYSVTAIIQYSSSLKHFVTWIHKSDGSWVEFDDLKYPQCKSFKILPVPAQEIHVVFWEEDSDIMDDISEQDTAITAEVDTTIGSTTLLDAFEGLTHNDIITLTLVEINKDSQQPPSNATDDEIEQAKDFKSQNVNSEMQDSFKNATVFAPDSSLTIETIEKPKENDCDHSVSEPEVSEQEDNMAHDPTFEPQPKRGQKRRRTEVTAQVKRLKVATPKGKLAKTISTTPVQCKSSPTVTSKPMSPVSSTVPTLLIVPKTSVIQPEQKGWCHLLERSLGHIQNTSKINTNRKPAMQSKKVFPIPLAPQQRGAVTIKVTPKPMLRTEDSGGLPLKAAEMYGAFGCKNAKLNSTVVNINKMPLEPPVQKAVTYNTVMDDSLSTSVAGLANNITSCKKTKSSKMPSGLSETEMLRYKLFKKLKAKKKKLAKLNEMLGQSGGDSFKPDSTNLSPNTVTSGTLDYEFFSDLLSPATTITSNLSPDSTDFLEMLANGQEATVGAEMSADTLVQPSTGAETADFLDEFMSQAVVERPSEMEEDALSALDLFL